MSTILHTYHDGSKLKLSTIRFLLDIPIWKGNRILDRDHVESILKSIELNNTDIQSLDSGFRVVVFDEEDAGGNIVKASYVIDGQHRLAAIRKVLEDSLCFEDFPITYVEKDVEDDNEAIEYFNCINHTKALKMDKDPNLIVNKFYEALFKAFPSKSKARKLIRHEKTRRPYLHESDLRDKLKANVEKLKEISVDVFVKRAIDWNNKRCGDLAVELALGESTKDTGIKELASELHFALALDTKFRWISDILG